MLDVGKRARRRVRRDHRVRVRVFGTAQRNRLNVFRSNAHLYAQVIDDTTGRTLLSASTLDKELTGTVKNGGNVTGAAVVGRLEADHALKATETAVDIDHSRYKDHGRVKALTESARQKG